MKKIRLHDDTFKKKDPSGVIFHEIGHNVSHNDREQSNSAVKEYREQFKWKTAANHDAMKKQLMQDGKLSESQAEQVIRQLNAERGKGTGRKGVVINGRHYRPQGKDGFYSYDYDAMPAESESQGIADPAWKHWDDDWEYGRGIDEEEVFADHYRIAVKEPERAYHDFITGPQAQVEKLKKSGASADEIQRAKIHAEKLEQQYHRMRKGVFGVDKAAVTEAAEGLPPGLKEKFIAEAEGDPANGIPAKVMTPKHLEELRKKYDAKGKTGP